MEAAMSDLRVEIMRAHQDVANSVPGAKNRLENLQAKFRTSGAMIERVGGSCSLIERGAGAATISPPRTGKKRASWQLGDKEELSYRDVKLVEHFVSYKVSLTSYVKNDILAEIRRAHQEAGEEIEAAGWLFAQYLPRGSSDSIEVVRATRSGSEPGTRTRVFLGDPIDAMVAVRNQGLGHLKLVGDWHCHTRGGSQLPSDADARAWAGTMDSLGRSAYVSVIVSPNDQGSGWTLPSFSAWVAGRTGHPSRPVVGRARIEC
jgi:hypothetical protein